MLQLTHQPTNPRHLPMHVFVGAYGRIRGMVIHVHHRGMARALLVDSLSRIAAVGVIDVVKQRVITIDHDLPAISYEKAKYRRDEAPWRRQGKRRGFRR